MTLTFPPISNLLRNGTSGLYHHASLVKNWGAEPQGGGAQAVMQAWQEVYLLSQILKIVSQFLSSQFGHQRGLAYRQN